MYKMVIQGAELINDVFEKCVGKWKLHSLCIHLCKFLFSMKNTNLNETH